MTFTVNIDPHPVRLNNTCCNLYIIYIYGVRGDLKNSDQYILQSVITVYGTEFLKVFHYKHDVLIILPIF